MKILITGANGMLGKDIAEIFSNSNHELILTDKENLNITNQEAVNKEINKIKPNILINCAGYIDVERAEENEEIANKINGNGILNLAIACKNNSCVLVHISTEYIFDGKNRDGYDENSIPNSRNVYGKSKALGEKLLKENLDNYYIIRTSWLYGKNPQLGKERGINFVDRVIELASQKDELNMVNDQFSKPTFTHDLASAIKKLIEEKYEYGIYHLVNEGATTPYEFAKEIFKIKNIDIQLNPISYGAYPSKVDRPINASLINTKFPLLRNWQDAIKDYLE